MPEHPAWIRAGDKLMHAMEGALAVVLLSLALHVVFIWLTGDSLSIYFVLVGIALVPSLKRLALNVGDTVLETPSPEGLTGFWGTGGAAGVGGGGCGGSGGGGCGGGGNCG